MLSMWRILFEIDSLNFQFSVSRENIHLTKKKEVTKSVLDLHFSNLLNVLLHISGALEVKIRPASFFTNFENCNSGSNYSATVIIGVYRSQHFCIITDRKKES